MKIVKLLSRASIISIIVLLIFSFCYEVNARNYVSEEYIEEIYNQKTIYYKEGIEFNYISERSFDEYIHFGYYLDDNFDNDEVEGEYTLVTNLEVTTLYNVKKSATMRAEYVFMGSKVSAVNYYFNDYLYYHFKLTEDGGGAYYEFEGFDLYDYYGEYVVAKIIDSTYDDNLAVFDYSAYYDVYFLEGHEYDNTVFLLYYLDDSDTEIVIDFENPMGLDDIIWTLGIKNKNNNRIGDYEILETNYEYNNVNIGMYNAKIIGFDNNYDIYLKNIFIIAKRMTNPINIVDIHTRYNEPLNNNDVINKISVNCDYSEIICNSSYFNNSNKCGDYVYTINIKTLDGQYFSKNGIINVYDDIAPIIEGPDSIQTDTENRLMEDEILDRYIISDDYDNNNLRIVLNELNDPDDFYINNYNLSGLYKFRISAYDQYDNYSYKDIKLYVSIANINVDNNKSSTSLIISTPTGTITSVPTTSSITTQAPINTPTSTQINTTTTPNTTTSINIPKTTSSTSNNLPTTTTPKTTNSNSTTVKTSTITSTSTPTSISSLTTPTTTSINPITPSTINPTTSTTIQNNITPVTSNTTNNTSTSATKREEFKLYASNKNHLSIEDIKNSLLDNNKITKDEYDLVSIESDYFDNYDNPGTYIINIRHEGGNLTSCLIEVKEQKEETKSKEEDNKEEINKKDIIFYSVIGGLVLIVLALLFMRRKNNEKNN